MATIDALARTAQSLRLALAAVDDIEKGLADLSDMERCASRMTVAMVVLCELVQATAEAAGRHPREVMEQIVAKALLTFPERPVEVPKVEDIPSRPVPPGPSPWGYE